MYLLFTLLPTIQPVTDPIYGQTWETKIEDGPDGTKSTKIDTEATLKKNNVDMATLKNDLLSFITTYQTENQKGTSHYAAIESAQKIQGRLNGDSTC